MPKGDAQKGQPRATGAGRKPGVPNKVTAELRQMLQQDIGKLSKEMMAMAMDPETKPEHRIKIWEVALKKTLPDLTATTLNPDADGNPKPFVIQVNPPTHDSNGNPL